jgi:hypothetical protein
MKREKACQENEKGQQEYFSGGRGKPQSTTNHSILSILIPKFLEYSGSLVFLMTFFN